MSLLRQAAGWANQNRTVVGVLAGAVAVMYGFYRASMWIMHFFFNVSDREIFNIGFVVGLLAAVVVAAGAVYVQRRFTVDADQVYRAALAQLRKHEKAHSVLGEFWRSSGFRGYKVESLKDAVQGSERRQRSSYLEAPSRRIQMLFMVKGVERSGWVSCQAHKRGGEYIFELLSLDVGPSGGKPPEHILLEGDQDLILFSELGSLLDATRRSGRREADPMDESD